MTLPLSNNGEGGSNGTTVTTGNSGGSSGDAFDVVTIGTGCTLKFSNTQFEDALSYEIATPATSDASFVAYSTAMGTQTELYGRIYLYLSANPVSQPIHLVKFRDGATEKGAIRITTGGVIGLRDNGGDIGGVMSTAIPLNQWVRIGFHIICNTSTGTIEAKLFSNADANAASVTETLTKTNRNTGTQITNVRFGETSVSGTITARTFYVDDIEVNTAAYPGPARVRVTLGGVGTTVPNAVAAVPSSSPFGDANAGPSTADTVASASTPSLSSDNTASPNVVEAFGTAYDATALPNTIATPSTAAAVAAIPAPTIISGAGTIVAPSTAAAVASALTPTISTTRSSPGGWGSEWGDMPWGGAELPFVPGGHPIIGRDEFPSPLPRLEHRFIGPNGQTDSPAVVSGFTADEDFGFATLQGVIEAERVRDQPGIYTDGAMWIVTDASTGDIVAAGDLLTPVIAGGQAAIKADGWAKRLLRKGERLMYAVAGSYSDTFVPKNSEPYGPSGQGYNDPGSDKFSIDASGALRWKISKGTDGWDAGPPPDQHGFIAAFIGLRPGVTRLKGHLHSSLAGANFTFKAYTTDAIDGSFGTGVVLHNFTSGGSDADFDVVTDPVGPVLIIQCERTTTGTSTEDIELTLTNLVTYGIASGSQWTASDVARDIAGRLGIAADVSESTLNILPIDAGADGVYADPLDTACLLSGMFYRVLGLSPVTPVLQLRHIKRRPWEIMDPEFPVRPVPLPRYDSVLIPYTLSNGVAQSVLEITADAIGQPMLPVHRSYGPVALPDPAPSEDNARLLGQRLLERVYPLRFAGTARFTRVYRDGQVVSAHSVHAQDSFILPLNGGVTLMSKALRRDGGVVEVTFDESVSSADRLIARKSRQIMLKHPT